MIASSGSHRLGEAIGKKVRLKREPLLPENCGTSRPTSGRCEDSRRRAHGMCEPRGDVRDGDQGRHSRLEHVKRGAKQHDQR